MDHGPDPFHHILDTPHIHPPHRWEIFSENIVPGGLYIDLPNILGFQITKLMILELIAAGLIIAIYIPLARRAASGEAPKGLFWNMFESLLTFIRDNVARPALNVVQEHHDEAHGEHGDHPAEEHANHHGGAPVEEADKYVPFLWTVFLFILFCNLLGMIPFLGSPTSNIWVTGVLGLIAFILFHGAAIVKMGVVPYIESLWPKMDMPIALALWVKPMIFAIELVGTGIKSVVLAVRLFANMFAGHLVLSVILMFIILANSTALGFAGWAGISVTSVLLVVALSLLELFVAFLQAYIFTFLTALFLGMSINPSH
jgi:F-type H+-transporting ATPase subunit a